MQVSRLSIPDENGASLNAPPEKVVVDPSKGGQVEAHDSQSGSRALTVCDGEWIWEGVQNVLEVDLFR
jgi:TATA-binding protein-associated factor